MFGWLRKKSKPLQPEARWAVAVGPDVLSVMDPDGATKGVAKDDLFGVAIETNDSGPWGADVWWLLFDSDGQLACAFPQGATGEQAAIDYFMALDGFDHTEMIAAMGSVENAMFPVWQRAV